MKRKRPHIETESKIIYNEGERYFEGYTDESKGGGSEYVTYNV